jgi:hypothetical protein
MSILRDIGLVVGLIIALVLAFFAYRELSVDRTDLYQEVNAKISDVRIAQNIETSTSSVANVRIINNKTVFNLTAFYTYLVNGKVYTGQYPVGKFHNIIIAQNERNRLMNVSPIFKVFYKKAKPSKSVRVIKKNNFIGYAVGAVFMVILSLVIKFAEFTPAPPQPMNPYGQPTVIINSLKGLRSVR